MGRILFSVALALLLTACVSTKSSPERAAAAKAAFDRVTKEFHLPSAEAAGPKRADLLAQAARGYDELLRQFPDQPFWCAQALRSLANIRVAQGSPDEAVRLYGRVAEKYPREDWEVLQAWKSAGDLLWESKRAGEAKKFYALLVTRFDTPEQPPVVKIVVNVAKKRLTATAD